MSQCVSYKMFHASGHIFLEGTSVVREGSNSIWAFGSVVLEAQDHSCTWIPWSTSVIVNSLWYTGQFKLRFFHSPEKEELIFQMFFEVDMHNMYRKVQNVQLSELLSDYMCNHVGKKYLPKALLMPPANHYFLLFRITTILTSNIII